MSEKVDVTTLSVDRARKLPEVEYGFGLPDGAKRVGRVDDPERGPFGSWRRVYFKDGEFFGGRWNRYRPLGSRVTVDGDVYEGRVQDPANALFAVMRLRQHREAEPPEDEVDAKVLISYEAIATAKHAKMTKVS